jgi:hypothetical protein
MVDVNYEIAKQHYSYSVLRNQLSSILISFFGGDMEHLHSEFTPASHKGYLYIEPQMVLYKHFGGRNGASRQTRKAKN